MKHAIPELGYKYDALEPFIDAGTMEIHHQKHHAAYCNNLNAALDGQDKLQKMDVNDLIADLDAVPEGIRRAVRNHGGGHANHSFFWSLLKTGVSFEGDIADAIKAKFGGLDEFKALFTRAGLGVFGSGWAWLVMKGSELEIVGTPNQDSPLSSGMKPLLGVDVWEHAYYLKYQNRRNEYLDAFFNVINWQKVNEHLKAAVK